MKTVSPILLILCCYLFSCSGSSQPAGPAFFEGSISYDIKFTRKTDKYDSLVLERVLGRSSEYFYKQGNMRIKNREAVSADMLYRVADNKSYTRRINADTIYWEFCGKPGPRVIDYSITPRKATILGILCDELTVRFENRTIITYYNFDTLRIDPVLHKACTMSNEDFFAEKKKALSLKFIIDRPDYTVTYTARSINNKKLSDTFFDIPPDAVLEEWK